jgi:hypothetical protein
MNFRTEVNITPPEQQISYRSNILSMGSCFTENIGEIMKELQFRIEVNPFGVNYNPSSVARNLWTLMNAKEYSPDDVHSDGDRWFSFDHHSDFSNRDRDACLENINTRIRESRKNLDKTDFLMLTWGTAWVYVYKKTANVVSNCHKVPAREFSRHLLTVNQVVDTCTKLFAAIRQTNPGLRIILTVSPVRHWKDGPQLNSVSKSTLVLAAYRLSEMFSYCDYFPAWEIAMDDLRDYRYYGEDLVHPNSQMVNYLWEKFTGAWLDEESKGIMKKIGKLVNAMKHRPFDQDSEKHRVFLEKQLEATRSLGREFPFLRLDELEKYFSSSTA